jgi:hypothetical protein
VLSTLLVAGALIGSAPGTCPATTVRYQSAKHLTLGELPWVLGEPQTSAVLAFLPIYPQALRDRRVNRRDGLVLWSSGSRIIWVGPGSSVPQVEARRLDGKGRFRLKLAAISEGFVSTPRFPTTGCWRFTARAEGNVASVVARVVHPPKRLGCDVTPLSDNGKAFVRPRSAGIYGGWTWRTSNGGALIYTHGIGPGDLHAKVPWWVKRQWGRSIELVGIRLDGSGSFSQVFWMALSPEGVFPSIVDVPSPGCWLFRLRTGVLAGTLVVRAIDRR